MTEGSTQGVSEDRSPLASDWPALITAAGPTATPTGCGRSRCATSNANRRQQLDGVVMPSRA